MDMLTTDSNTAIASLERIHRLTLRSSGKELQQCAEMLQALRALADSYYYEAYRAMVNELSAGCPTE